MYEDEMISGWVIGGTSGIGEQAAILMRQNGIPTFVDGHMSFDVRQPLSAFRDKLEEYGLPMYVVYAAGINYLEFLGAGDDLDDHHLDVIDVNLKGFIKLMDAMAHFANDYESSPEPPSIVAISSDAAERPLRTSIGYCSSKAGLNQAVRVAARELGVYGWRVNAIAPGMTSGTNMTAYVDEAVPRVRKWSTEAARHYERVQEVTPGRIKPSDVADIVFQTLMGPTHLNGSIITLNGGR